MYRLHKRVSELGINCLLKDNLSWDMIDFQIDTMNSRIDYDVIYHTKVNSYRDLDKINYQLCVDRIIECCKKKIKYNKDDKKILLFSFDIDDHCPITNYSYLTIFFGPIDIDANICFTKIRHIFKTNLSANGFCFEIQNKEKIHFKLFLI
jgi:hypothetical protein